MLRKIDNKTIESSEGYTVRYIDIHYLEYSEGSKTATVEIEGGVNESGDVDWLLYRNSLKGWNAPFDEIIMTEDQHNTIIERISECLKMLGMKHKVE
jgi:hypothetical protein